MDISSWFAGFSLSALWTIIIADILLSGDNAVVIALATKELPDAQRKKAIVLGTLGAIVMRVVLAAFATTLLQYPYLKIIGALLLLYIAIDLLVESDDDIQGKPVASLKHAVWMILVADLTMSLDNVIAIAAAAQGHLGMLIFGLALSIPLIIFGSAFLLKVMDRFPIIVILGAAVLGWLAGDMLCTDPSTKAFFEHQAHWVEYTVKVACTLLVVAVAWWKNGKHLQWHAGLPKTKA